MRKRVFQGDVPTESPLQGRGGLQLAASPNSNVADWARWRNTLQFQNRRIKRAAGAPDLLSPVGADGTPGDYSTPAATAAGGGQYDESESAEPAGFFEYLRRELGWGKVSGLSGYV